MNCVIAPGSPNEGGYIRFRRNGRRVYAHRYAWEQVHGEIPDGLKVCHTCDNPPCINAEHLFLGTQKINMEDCASKNRVARGQRSGKAKLSRNQVLNMRNNWATGLFTMRQLADSYGVSVTHVNGIVHGSRRLWD